MKENKSKETSNTKDELKHAAEHLANIAKHAKSKYDNMDDKTKKKIAGAMLGAAALIASAVGIKKAVNKKR